MQGGTLQKKAIASFRDLYVQYVDAVTCKRLIKTYEVISKQLYKLREVWKTFEYCSSRFYAQSPKSAW